MSSDNENPLSVINEVITKGDLTKLNADERLEYYNGVCKSVGLNPLTMPFVFMTLQGKMTLYARKDATDQLRKIHGISIEIVSREMVDGLYVVTARATDRSGRCDESVGAVNLGALKGEQAANAIMKAETKAKRRVTLSIAGLGLLDENEVDTIPNAASVDFNIETGEIVDRSVPVKTHTSPKHEGLMMVSQKGVEYLGGLIFDAGDDIAGITDSIMFEYNIKRFEDLTRIQYEAVVKKLRKMIEDNK